jgi:hypothetical protein
VLEKGPLGDAEDTDVEEAADHRAQGEGHPGEGARQVGVG